MRSNNRLLATNEIERAMKEMIKINWEGSADGFLM